MKIVIEDFVEGMETGLREVFYTAVRMACAKDYSKDKLDIWAAEIYDQQIWSERIKGIRPFVARLDGKIVGYSDLQKDGYIDHFFVHGEHQGQGVGAALMSTILSRSTGLDNLHSHVSITAKPFFMRHGFTIVNAQKVWISNVEFINYAMQRQLKI